jgi:hypothetical protein
MLELLSEVFEYGMGGMLLLRKKVFQPKKLREWGCPSKLAHGTKRKVLDSRPQPNGNQ